MQTALLPPLLLPLLLPIHAAEEETALDHAVKAGMISVSAQSTGGHSDKCLMVELVNHTDHPVRTTVPAGWLMQNSDPEAQDLMIVDLLPVDLPPHGSRSVACKAYCVESTDRSPTAGTALRSMGMARATWVKLAEHLLKNDATADDAQAAVWAVANGHDIAAIGASNTSLRKFVAELTGREVPWYAKNYAPPTEEGRVFSDVPTTVHGEIDFRLNTHGVVTVLVHNAQGQLMRTIGKERHLGPGAYDMEIDLTVQGWAKGTYTIQFFVDGSRLLKRLQFEV